MTDTWIPHILALDTAQEDCGAAILLADGSLFMHVEHVGSRHSERLLPMVRDLIHEAGIEKTDLGLIAFGEGPGSFTGLRVACGAVHRPSIWRCAKAISRHAVSMSSTDLLSSADAEVITAI